MVARSKALSGLACTTILSPFSLKNGAVNRLTSDRGSVMYLGCEQCVLVLINGAIECKGRFEHTVLLHQILNRVCWFEHTVGILTAIYIILIL